MKRLIYNICSKVGIKVFSTLFPEYFAKEPLKPSDRYIEYNFAVGNLPKYGRVLDVGCAGSYFPLLLSGFGYHTWGMDIREYAIVNRIQFPLFTFIQDDITNGRMSPGFFEAITSISTIEHIGLSGRYGAKEAQRGDLKAVKEMKRLLCENGILILTFPYAKSKVIKPFCRIYGKDDVKELSLGMITEEIRYYNQNNDWYECSEEEASLSKATADKSPICLLKLRKP
jgi:SAM-dependent methyltransferase